MKTLVRFSNSLAVVLVLAFTLAPAPAAAESCAAWLSPEASGGLRINGWAEMREPSSAWIVDADGNLLQVLSIRFDPIASVATRESVGPILSGVFSERAGFTMEPSAHYRALVVAPQGEVSCVAWFTAPGSPTACQARFTRLKEGDWLVAGTTVARGAAAAQILDQDARIAQVFPVLYDPLTVDFACGTTATGTAQNPAPVGRFSGRAQFDPNSSEFWKAVVLDAYGQLLCIDLMSSLPPSATRIGDAATSDATAADGR